MSHALGVVGLPRRPCNTVVMDRPEIEFTYVGDTMCSWCWGFAPTVERLQGHYAFPMRLINGGLRPGPNAQALDDDMRAYLNQAWARVAAASGQPFNDAVLDTEGWIYDTELPARAVVTMRAHNESQEWQFFKRLQLAFYAEGEDVTNESVYPGILNDFSVDVDAFMADLADEKSRLAAWEDFEQAQVMQAQGFPTLLLRTGSDMATVTRGYRAFEDIEPHLTKYLAERYEPADFLA